MKRAILGLIAAGAMSAQTVGGPVLGYVVDGDSRLRPVYGMPAAANIGAPLQDGVKDNWGDLVLQTDGTALRAGKRLDGEWSSVQPGAFLDASGQEVLIAAGSGEAWHLTLPSRALAVRVSAGGERALTLLADGSLAAWSVSGKALYRLNASTWWSVAFAGERAIAYDPAANALIRIDDQGTTSVERQLDGEGGAYQLAVDSAARYAVLLGENALIVPLGGGLVRTVTPPDGAARLEAVQGGRAFLLTRDPAQPLWVLDPQREDVLLVIPALPSEKGGQQ